MVQKILNEILKVYDFDSWDNTESEFKGEIKKSLKDKVFIYFRKYHDRAQLAIFGLSWITLGGKSYKSGKVYINGECVELTDHGSTKKLFDHEQYDVVLKDIEEITTARMMFRASDLYMVPKGLDLSRCCDITGMFEYCEHLQCVPPINFNLELLRKTFFEHNNLSASDYIGAIGMGMFEGCWELWGETINLWGINRNGTPTNISEVIEQYEYDLE